MRVLILLGLICAACALPRQSRIVGGEITTIENYPFTAAMLTRAWSGTYYQSCGGTLITPSAVVTAGHCFDTATSLPRVRLGSSYASFGGAEHLVSRVIIHKQYHPLTFINDIAVVRLSDPAVLSDRVKTASIAGPGYILPVNTVVQTMGWGDIEYDGYPSEILRHVSVNVINQQICADRYAYLKTQPGMSKLPDVTPEMICFGILDVGGKDSCQGDSGGPVIHGGNVLVGITSWGYQCAHPVYPGVSARVSSYTDWIYTNSIN